MNQLTVRLAASIIAGVTGLGLHVAGQPGAARAIITLVVAVVVVPNILSMVRTLRSGGFGVDVLAVTAIMTALVLGEDIAAIVIVMMLTTGEALEEYAERHARTELTALLERSPKLAHVWRGHATVDIPVSQVAPGDQLMIKPGEVVPVDARIIDGSTSVDESAITGESLPVDKQPGDELLSGAVNTSGLIHAEALRTSAGSQYEQIVAMVQDASSRRSPLVRLADQYSVPFTAVSFAIAGAAWAVSRNPLHALEVLVVATPCPLLIAAPVAIVSGMSRAAGAGIIAKSGAALERLARLRTMAFDKTGTLTQGRPRVAAVHPAAPITADRLLATAAALEQASAHVLAAAIVAEATGRRLHLPHVSALRETAGQGVRGQLQGQTVLVGRSSYLEAAGVSLPAAALHDRTSTYVAINGTYAGAITFADQLRPETKQVLADLKAQGIRHTFMLTGDRAATAHRVAHELGITDVQAECLPADKVAALAGLPPRLKPVAMVGDGVNDAPTLAASDVGIALGAKGSTAASQSADVVIMADDLGRVPVAIRIARRSIGIARQSIGIGIALSIVLMLVAATGAIPPVIGALLQEAVDVAVIVNALRARRA